MFGKKKAFNSARIDTLIGQGTVVNGDLIFSGGLHVDGKIVGNVMAEEGSTQEAKVHCGGINACRGQAECKTAANACKGQNACKGKGFISTTEDECAERGGTVVEG